MKRTWHKRKCRCITSIRLLSLRQLNQSFVPTTTTVPPIKKTNKNSHDNSKTIKKPLSQLSHNAYSIIYSIVTHCPTLLRPVGARWMGERSPRHRGCALRACLLPELLSASGASQYHHTHCPTSANAAGTADPINNPTLRSDSDAGWGQQHQLNSSPNGRPPFVPPTVPLMIKSQPREISSTGVDKGENV